MVAAAICYIHGFHFFNFFQFFLLAFLNEWSMIITPKKSIWYNTRNLRIRLNKMISWYIPLSCRCTVSTSSEWIPMGPFSDCLITSIDGREKCTDSCVLYVGVNGSLTRTKIHLNGEGWLIFLMHAPRRDCFLSAAQPPSESMSSLPPPHLGLFTGRFVMCYSSGCFFSL